MVRKKQVPIESFSSYEGLYKNPIPYTTNALLLISASTSANILGYILDLHKMITRDNILILFFLGDDSQLANIKDQLICNLNHSAENPNGIAAYRTYKQSECEFCKKGSYPVVVSGDVFLLEKPHVNRVLIGIKDAELYLSDFVMQFKIGKRTKITYWRSIIKKAPNLNMRYISIFIKSLEE